MAFVTNTAAPAPDSATDLVFYCRHLDALTDANYTSTGVGLQRCSHGTTCASNKMGITVDKEVLVAYCAVAAQAATKANQIHLNATLVVQGAVLYVAHEIASNSWCALTAEPVVDQADHADCAWTWDNNAPAWGRENVGTTAAG